MKSESSQEFPVPCNGMTWCLHRQNQFLSSLFVGPPKKPAFSRHIGNIFGAHYLCIYCIYVYINIKLNKYVCAWSSVYGAVYTCLYMSIFVCVFVCVSFWSHRCYFVYVYTIYFVSDILLFCKFWTLFFFHIVMAFLSLFHMILELCLF